MSFFNRAMTDCMTNKPYIPLLLIAAMWQTSQAVAALPASEHHQPADVQQPIAVMDKLSSLKDAAPLVYNAPKFERFSTQNGVPVLFFQTRQLPIVDVSLRFDAGSARDTSIRPQALGLASLTADTLTKGVMLADGFVQNETDIAIQLETLGAQLESTAYKDQLVVNLRTLSDPTNWHGASQLINRMLLTPQFDPAVIERRKSQRLLSLKSMLQSPRYLANRAFYQAVYAGHPYANSAYGSVDSVPTLTRDDVVAFWQQFGVARNAHLSITGDLSYDEAKRLANVLVEGLPQGQTAPALPKPPSTEATHIHVDYDSEQTTVVMGQLGYALTADSQELMQHAAFNVGNEVLAGSGFGSRLMTEIRKKQGYTYGIYGSMSPMQVAGPYHIEFSARTAVVQDAINNAFDVINTTVQDGVDHDEYLISKNSLINGFPMNYASNAAINAMLGSMVFYDLPTSYFYEYPSRMAQVDRGAVNMALKRYLQPQNFVVVSVGSQQPNLTYRTRQSNATVIRQ